MKSPFELGRMLSLLFSTFPSAAMVAETASSLSSLGAALLALGQAEGSGAGAGRGAHSGQGYTLGGDLGAVATEGSRGIATEQQVEQQELTLLMGRAFVDVGKRCESVSTLILQQVCRWFPSMLGSS